MSGERCQPTLDALLHPLKSHVARRGGKVPASHSGDSRGVSVTNPFMVTGAFILLSGFETDFPKMRRAETGGGRPGSIGAVV
jgi:hypothetical protein